MGFFDTNPEKGQPDSTIGLLTAGMDLWAL